MLYLWKISQSVNTNYDTWDSAVVVAATEDAARRIHPSDHYESLDWPWWDASHWPHGNGWAPTLEDVRAEKLAPLGNSDYKAGSRIIVSFNSG